MNIMLCNSHLHRLYNLHIQIFPEGIKSFFCVARNGKVDSGGGQQREDRRAVTLDTMRIPAQHSVPHQTSAGENIRQKKILLSKKAKAFLVRENQPLSFS